MRRDRGVLWCQFLPMHISLTVKLHDGRSWCKKNGWESVQGYGRVRGNSGKACWCSRSSYMLSVVQQWGFQLSALDTRWRCALAWKTVLIYKTLLQRSTCRKKQLLAPFGNAGNLWSSTAQGPKQFNIAAGDAVQIAAALLEITWKNKTLLNGGMDPLLSMVEINMATGGPTTVLPSCVLLIWCDFHPWMRFQVEGKTYLDNLHVNGYRTLTGRPSRKKFGPRCEGGWREPANTHEKWAVGNWTVPQSWSHVIDVRPRLVDEIVSSNVWNPCFVPPCWNWPRQNAET